MRSSDRSVFFMLFGLSSVIPVYKRSSVDVTAFFFYWLLNQWRPSAWHHLLAAAAAALVIIRHTHGKKRSFLVYSLDVCGSTGDRPSPRSVVSSPAAASSAEDGGRGCQTSSRFRNETTGNVDRKQGSRTYERMSHSAALMSPVCKSGPLLQPHNPFPKLLFYYVLHPVPGNIPRA